MCLLTTYFFWIFVFFQDGVVHPNLIQALAMVEQWSFILMVYFSVANLNSFCLEKKMHVWDNILRSAFMVTTSHTTQSFHIWGCCLMCTCHGADRYRRPRPWPGLAYGFLGAWMGGTRALLHVFFPKTSLDGLIPMVFYGAKCRVSILCSNTLIFGGSRLHVGGHNTDVI